MLLLFNTSEQTCQVYPFFTSLFLPVLGIAISKKICSFTGKYRQNSRQNKTFYELPKHFISTRLQSGLLCLVDRDCRQWGDAARQKAKVAMLIKHLSYRRSGSSVNWYEQLNSYVSTEGFHSQPLTRAYDSKLGQSVGDSTSTSPH